MLHMATFYLSVIVTSDFDAIWNIHIGYGRSNDTTLLTVQLLICVCSHTTTRTCENLRPTW